MSGILNMKTVMFPNIILVWISARKLHKPYDANFLKLMNSCAVAVLEEYADVVFAYGFSDEYTFIFKKTSKFYERRPSKVLSIITSFFSSVFVRKWSEFIPQKELQSPPSFHGQVIACASIEALQAYLWWRQNICHLNNLFDQCIWRLAERGMNETEAWDFIRGFQKCDLNSLLFDEFNVNYNTLDPIFRQGSCVLKTVVEDVVKYTENGAPIKRQKRKIVTVHSKKISSKIFWSEQTILLKELGGFVEEINNVKPEYVSSFELESKLLAFTWIVIRLDGCHFHKFSEIHEFVKPNDVRALNLMNSCAVAVLEEFRQDIVFAYGASDEYSFILKESTNLYQRRAFKIISAIVSFFTSTYVMRWKDFFPQNELKYSPSFDGRAVCYPSPDKIRDYLAWRQVDCHINNQYNSCFWKLVAFGKSKKEAEHSLKGVQRQKKIMELGIDYNELPIMFRLGSSVFWERVGKHLIHQENEEYSKSHGKVIVDHCDIIGSAFWLEHPDLLDGNLNGKCSADYMAKEGGDTFVDIVKEGEDCITVAIENSKNSVSLDAIRDEMIPFLLGTAIKGFLEIKKVDILWNNLSKASKSYSGSSGELYLRVTMSSDCGSGRFWGVLMNHCLKIMPMIDWARSRPDNIHHIYSTNGIEAGWQYFHESLASATSETGKSILPKHLSLVANCLSSSGEFVGLNSRGMAQQRKHASISSPFVQACFSNPGTSFIKAAKSGVMDNLQGNIDSMAWGNCLSMGTSGQFDVIYSEEVQEFAKPVDVYNLLKASSDQMNKIDAPHFQNYSFDKCGSEFRHKNVGYAFKEHKQWKSLLRNFVTVNDIWKLTSASRFILNKYSIDEVLSEGDKSTMLKVLHFHPHKNEKFGSGPQDIKVGWHPKYKESRCFFIVRSDGTVEDFSYRKCILAALDIVDPKKSKIQKQKWLGQHDMEAVSMPAQA